MKTQFKRSTVIAIAAAISFLSACKKDQGNASALTHYKVTDRMLINDQDGRPRSAGTLPVLSANEIVALHDEALNARKITIKNATGENMLLTVTGNKDGKLSLEQPYDAKDGLASGMIYYTLTAN